MPTEIQVQDAILAGAEIETVTADIVNGNRFTNDGRCLFIANGGAAGQVLTFETPYTREGLELADNVVTIPLGEQWIGAIGSTTTFNRGPGVHQGQVYFTSTAAEDISIIRLP